MKADMMFYEASNGDYKRVLVGKNGAYFGIQLPEGTEAYIDGDMIHVLIPEKEISTIINGLITLTSELIERAPDFKKTPYAVAKFRPKVNIDDKIYEDIDIDWEGYAVFYVSEGKMEVEFIRDPNNYSNIPCDTILFVPMSKKFYAELMDVFNLPEKGKVSIANPDIQDFFLSYIAYIMSIGIQVPYIKGSSEGVVR